MDDSQNQCDEAMNLIKSEKIDEEVMSMNLSDDLIELKPVVGLQTSTPSSEVNEPTGRNYDEVFDSVIAQSVAGTLKTEPKRSKNKMNPVEAADSFIQLNENKSPTSVEGLNEVTPYTSPFDDSQNLSKFLLQNPKKPKAKPSKESNSFRKRTVLGYDGHENKIKKHSGKKHSRRVNWDSNKEEVTPKQKVLSKGVWVQCCIRSCLKWRFLQDCIDPSVIPDFWSCSMNENDPDQNKCTTPEIDWTECISSSQDHFVYSDYNEGSIVWAKMPGYPYWPAMVESDPDFQMFYEYDEDGVVSRYHVVFLDENVSRAWVSSRSIESYSDNNMDKTQIIEMAGHFKKALAKAVETADFAYKLSLTKRIEMYNFECRFTKEKHAFAWNEKKHRSKKSRAKIQQREESSQQIVPEVNNSPKQTLEEVEENFITELESCKSDPDYWQNAKDDDSVDSGSDKEEIEACVEEKKKKGEEKGEKKKEKKREKAPRKDKNKPQAKKNKPKATETSKQPVVSKPQFTKEKTKTSSTQPTSKSFKPKFKPSFNAPVKPVFSVKKKKVVSSPPSAVVPTVETEERKTVLKPIENKKKPLNDPFVTASQFTQAEERKEEDSPVEERRNHLLSDTLQCEVGSGCMDRPIKLSLQSTGHLENNDNISGSDFWLNADSKNKKDNPFSELEMEIGEEGEKVTDQWTDEKLKELDEHMPPITDF